MDGQTLGSGYKREGACIGDGLSYTIPIYKYVNILIYIIYLGVYMCVNVKKNSYLFNIILYLCFEKITLYINILYYKCEITCYTFEIRCVRAENISHSLFVNYAGIHIYSTQQEVGILGEWVDGVCVCVSVFVSVFLSVFVSVSVWMCDCVGCGLWG